jgi:hypothetical protein
VGPAALGLAWPAGLAGGPLALAGSLPGGALPVVGGGHGFGGGAGLASGVQLESAADVDGSDMEDAEAMPPPQQSSC